MAISAEHRSKIDFLIRQENVRLSTFFQLRAALNSDTDLKVPTCVVSVVRILVNMVSSKTSHLVLHSNQSAVVCFVWIFLLGFSSHSKIFTHLETSPLKISNLNSALMAIEQRGFFNVPNLLWHEPTLYNGHLWGPVTLTSVAEGLAVELSLPIF